jgi:hypothetical protein
MSLSTLSRASTVVSNFSFLTHSCFKDQKSPSIIALPYQSPGRIIEHVLPSTCKVSCYASLVYWQPRCYVATTACRLARQLRLCFKLEDIGRALREAVRRLGIAARSPLTGSQSLDLSCSN